MSATTWSESDILESKLLHRSLNHAPQIVTSTEGSYLRLSNGKSILDGCGGAAVVSVGHSNPVIIEQMSEQLKTVCYVHTSDYSTPVSETFANELLENYKDTFAKAYLINSGSEATESAVKLATQYFQEKGKPEKTQFISRLQSYHGNCMAGLSLSGHVARRKPYKGILSPNFHFVSPAYEFRYKKPEESSEDYVKRLVAEFESKVLEVGPEKVAAFYAETVVGATTGCVTAPANYFAAIRQICDKYDILLILDEVMCGSGRTGTFFAWEQENVKPDIVTCGKSISSGYSPLSACIFNHKIASVLSKGSGGFNHGHTYQAFPLSCQAGLAVQRYVKSHNLLDNVVQMGHYLEETLRTELSSLPIVGDIRGRGLFWGMEFVKSKDTMEPFDPKLKFGHLLQQKILENGVAVYPGMGTVDGLKGDHIIAAPMFTVTREEIDIIVRTIKKSIEELLQEISV